MDEKLSKKVLVQKKGIKEPIKTWARASQIPAEYYRLGGTVSGGFGEIHRGFGKYSFRPIDWEREERNPEVLCIGRPEDFSTGAKIIKMVNFLNGQPAILLVEG